MRVRTRPAKMISPAANLYSHQRRRAKAAAAIIGLGVSVIGAVAVFAHGTNPDTHYIGFQSCSQYIGKAWHTVPGGPKSLAETYPNSGGCDQFYVTMWPWNGSAYVGYDVGYWHSGLTIIQNDFTTSKVYGYHQARVGGLTSSTSETFAQ